VRGFQWHDIYISAKKIDQFFQYTGWTDGKGDA